MCVVCLSVQQNFVQRTESSSEILHLRLSPFLINNNIINNNDVSK